MVSAPQLHQTTWAVYHSRVATSVSRGLGAETAKMLKAAGARVIGMDLRDSAENVDRFILFDLANANTINAAVAQIDEPIHGLCNIAKHKILREMSLNDDIAAFCAENDIAKANSYHFSKEAVVAWTIGEWKRRESHGVRINAVSPGTIQTPLLSDFVNDMAPKNAPFFEMKNPHAKPADIANIILFLQDDASRWIHAANIPVDSGLAAIVAKRIFQF